MKIVNESDYNFLDTIYLEILFFLPYHKGIYLSLQSQNTKIRGSLVWTAVSRTRGSQNRWEELRAESCSFLYEKEHAVV